MNSSDHDDKDKLFLHRLRNVIKEQESPYLRHVSEQLKFDSLYYGHVIQLAEKAFEAEGGVKQKDVGYHIVRWFHHGYLLGRGDSNSFGEEE